MLPSLGSDLRAYFLVLALLVGGAALTEPLPVAAFAAPPLLRLPTVSPDGQYVAAVLNTPDGQAVAVGRFGTGDLEPIVRIEDGGDRVDTIRWAGNARLLIEISELITPTDVTGNARAYYIASRQVDRELQRLEERLYHTGPNRIRRLYQARRDGNGTARVWRRQNRPVSWAIKSHSDYRIVSMLPDEPDHILLQLYAEWDDTVTVFNYDLRNGRSRKLFTNSFGAQDWYANTDGEVVFGWQRTVDGATAWFRPDAGTDWQSKKLRDELAAVDIEIVSISGTVGYVLSSHGMGRRALWSFDLATAEFGETVYAVDGFDVRAGLTAAGDGRLVGALTVDDAEQQHFLDDRLAGIADLVRASFPGKRARIRSQSRDGERLIIETVSSTAAPQYFWLNLGTKKGAAWYAPYPDLNNETLVPTTAIAFKADDGMQITGYLTLPETAGNDKPPLVVYAHDGPHERVANDFDPFVQLFANRGYAVLQVNHRGSSGFGRAFEEAGYREWGRAMQSDVYDGIRWVIEEGLVDGGSTCMVGQGYGGYVALTAAYQRPLGYRCVVSINGIPDALAYANREGVVAAYREAIERRLGNPYDRGDRERLRDISPVSHANNIAAPVLLVHGTHNARIPVTQSRAFHEEALRWGANITYLELDGGTHLLDNYRHRLAVFEALDEFLQEHL